MALNDNFIQEDITFNTESQIIEGVDGKPKKYYVRGEFGRANSLNKNGRMYSKSVYEKAIQENTQILKDRRMLGELGHPPTPQINLAEASHLITKLEMKGDILWGEAEILPTPKGEILKTLIESGVKLGISTRAVGSVIKNGNITEVGSDYKLITADIVSDPSSYQAFPTPVYEEVDDRRTLQDIINKTLK